MAEGGKKRSVRRKDESVNLDTLGLEVGNRPPQALDVEEAGVYSCSPEDIISATTANAETVFCR